MSPTRLHIASILSLFICIISVNIKANIPHNFPQLRFNSLTVNDGLPINKTNGVAKDNKGFIWIATRDGICRFDGFSTKVYYADNNNLKQSNRSFTAIYGDKRGNLYAGATYLYKFNYETEKLVKLFQQSDFTEPRRIRSIKEDSDLNIWIGAENGLFKLDSLNHLTHLAPQDENINFTIRDVIKCDNEVWFATHKHGLGIYDLASNSYYNIPLFNNSQKPVKCILSVFEQNDTIWVGTMNDGLFKIKLSTRKVISNEYPDKDVNRVRDIVSDQNNNIWLGTINGLYLFNRHKNTYTRYAYIKHPESSLTYNSIFDIFIDDNEVMWLSTYTGGINFTDLNYKPFKLLQSHVYTGSNLSSPSVTCFNIDADNKVYIGTEYSGLNIWDRTKNTHKHYSHKSKQISGTNIKCIEPGPNDNIWIGTYNGGISRLNPKTGTFKYYTAGDNLKGNLQSDHVYDMKFDENQNLWIASVFGVDLLDIETDSIVAKHHSNNMSTLCIDRYNRIWYGNDKNGLMVYNTERDTFENYFSQKEFYSINTIFHDSEDQLWVGGKNGITIINLYNKDTYAYTTQNGLSSNIINSIIEDNLKNIWLSSAKGLMKLENAVQSPEDFSIYRYTKEDGLQSNQFGKNSSYISLDGELFFGGINGFNHFYPEDIKENPYLPKLAFTELKIFNKSVCINEIIKGQEVLTKSLNETQQITLNHKHKVFTLEFAALHYSDSKSNSFKYMLYPFEDQWNRTQYPRNFATYTSLPPGKYVFKLQGSNNDGKWQSGTRELIIRIRPPFYASWWFILIVVCFISFNILFFVNRRIKRIRLQKVRLEKLVNKRTKEIKKQKEKLEGLNRLKDKLFSILAHDLKTPFQSILGFSDLIKTDYNDLDDQEIREYIDLINDSAHSYYELLENLLKWSRSQTGGLSYEPLNINLEQLANKSLDLNKQKLDQKGISVYNNIPANFQAFADESMLYSVIHNLFGNAIKFTPPKGNIEFGCERKEDHLIMSIKDTGVGIPENIQKTLFTVGETISRPGTNGEPGTGLGLLICKEFISKNKGNIWFESSSEKGTTFYFTLPVSS